MPSFATASSTACADSYVPETASPVISAWSAAASRVASGIVLTVPGATRSSTYIVSLYAGSLTPVEAQSGRCRLACAFSSSAQRAEAGVVPSSEPKTFSYAW